MTEPANSPKGTTEVDRYIGGRVRARRLQCGLSQQKLADALGVTFPQVQKYENGTNRISVSRLQQISNVLGMSAASFFEGLSGEDESSASDDVMSDEHGQREVLRLWNAIRDPMMRRTVLTLMDALTRR